MAKAKPAKPTAKAKKPAPAKAKATKPAAVVKKAKPAPKAAKTTPKAAKPAKPVKAAKAAKPAKPVKLAAKPVAKTSAAKVNGSPRKPDLKTPPAKANGIKLNLTPFLKKQQERLLQLRDSLLDAMAGVAKDNLRSRAEGSEASAFGMHQADAGSDAYDRDFALSLLSQEQDALYEIEEALKRIEQGTYGTCEMSGKAIAHARLEALPFARYTVECQSQLEKQNRVSRTRVPVTSLFGLTDEEPGEKEDEEEPVSNTDKE
jgi:RNA polymerase-binding transcription factor DksA